MKSFRHFALALTVLIPLALAPSALAQSALPGIGGVSYDEGANTLTLTIPYRGRNPYRVLWLNGPNRLVVDIEGLHLTGKRSLFIGGGVVTRIRAARWQRNITRVVFDLAQPADLRTVTDGSSQSLMLTVYPRGSEPAMMGGTPVMMEPIAQATPRPRATPRPAPTVPSTRITPAPVYTPEPMVPTPEPTVMPTPEPTPVPTEEPVEVEIPIEEPTPMPEESPTAVEEREFMVFGSRFTAGADLPLSLAETYPLGKSNSSISGIIPVGAFSWDQMFTPNVGISANMKAMSYTFDDQAATFTGAIGSKIAHRRDEYEGGLGIRGRLGLPAGLELMLQPGFMVRSVGVQNLLFPIVGGVASPLATGSATTLNEYMYSGYLGYGASVGFGLGWHLIGPLSLAVTGEGDYLFAGSMNVPNVPSVFPMIGIKGGGEVRLDLGWFGLAAGYNLTNYTHSGSATGDNLAQSWSGPYVKTSIVY